MKADFADKLVYIRQKTQPFLGRRTFEKWDTLRKIAISFIPPNYAYRHSSQITDAE